MTNQNNIEPKPDDTLCECGHPQSEHYFRGVECIHGEGETACRCPQFKLKEGVEPSPAPVAAYACKVCDQCGVVNGHQYSCIHYSQHANIGNYPEYYVKQAEDMKRWTDAVMSENATMEQKAERFKLELMGWATVYVHGANYNTLRLELAESKSEVERLRTALRLLEGFMDVGYIAESKQIIKSALTGAKEKA